MNRDRKQKAASRRASNQGMTLIEVSIAFVLLMVLLAVFSSCIRTAANMQMYAWEQNQAQDERELAEYAAREGGVTGEIGAVEAEADYRCSEFSLQVPLKRWYPGEAGGTDADSFYIYGEYVAKETAADTP